MMKLTFNGGEFVCNENGLNYETVLEDFKAAKMIRILTYNISKNIKDDKLIELLENIHDTVDIEIITNIPSRFPQYYNSKAGDAMRAAFKNNCDIYLKKLDPENFQAPIFSAFNFKNHAKIIGTENIVYIGSANYSNESNYNIETGIIIRDKEFIKSLYVEFFEYIKGNSIPYFDDDFNTLRLFVVSMETKFKIHYQKLMDSLFYIQQSTNNIRLRNTQTYLSREDLYELEADIDELIGLDIVIEDTYSDDDEYNDVVDLLVQLYNKLSIDSMIQFSMEDSDLCNYIRFDINEMTNDCLEKYSAEAYDEYLEEYVSRATEDAQDIWEGMKDELEPEAVEFLEEIKKIVDTLEVMHEKLVEVATSRISPEIDNT